MLASIDHCTARSVFRALFIEVVSEFVHEQQLHEHTTVDSIEAMSIFAASVGMLARGSTGARPQKDLE